MDSVAEELQKALDHHKAGRLQQAETSYRQILAIEPAHADCLHLLGLITQDTGRLDLAVSYIGQAVALQPEVGLYHFNLAIAYTRQGRLSDAEASYREAVRLTPDYADAYSGLGDVLRMAGRNGEAEACYRDAIKAKPDFADAHNNLGAVLSEFGRFDEAASHLRTALRIAPRYFNAHNNLGCTLMRLCLAEEAETSLRAALDLVPDHAYAHMNLAHALLLKGDMPAGFLENEWRWQAIPTLRRPFMRSHPNWEGEDIRGRTLLLHAEQGFGDTLQFCRYLTLAAARGARIVLEVPRPLTRLLGTLDGVDQIIATGDPLPTFDCHCALLSLPRVLGTGLDSIPADMPYLKADPSDVGRWRKRLAGVPGLRAGLVWAGSPRPFLPEAAAADKRRSVTLDHFLPLADIKGVSFVSLQKAAPASTALRSPPSGLILYDFMDEIDDFADTAALIENLDLVISVDTAPLHLAGALGKQVWLLNRFDTCWRWLRDRSDSPWYPSLRQFRQPVPGDWTGPILKVKAELARFVAAASS